MLKVLYVICGIICANETDSDSHPSRERRKWKG
jgi:hypothetical protein